MNLGLSSSVKEDFPHIIPVIRPLIENMVIPHPEWMAGFVSGEGSFSVYTTSDDKYVSLSFRVSQHNKDKQLLKSFVDFFGCGGFNYHNKVLGFFSFFVSDFFQPILLCNVVIDLQMQQENYTYKSYEHLILFYKCKIKENMNSYRKSSVN